MLCDICKKTESTVHLTQIVDGKMLKVDLCESCAKEKGVQEAAGFSLANLLAGLGTGEESRIEAAGVQCPVCGFTQADFKKTGRLGCSGCWEAFEASLGSLLRAMHKGDHHVGKVPVRAAHTLAVSNKMQELTEQLEKAVREEKYEDAAQIRDQIHELEAKRKKSADTTTRSAE
jgi:protein arginine kinase activator